MTEPWPEGGVVVASFPARAGKRGRVPNAGAGGYNWDVAVAAHRANPGTHAFYDGVPSGSVPKLRATYPDTDFITFHTRLEWSTQREKPREVCTVYVVWPKQGAGEDADQVTDAGT
jgi:hypothetical protein